MAKTILEGYLLKSGGSAATLHTNAGRIRAVLISHAQSSAVTATFYNDTAATGGKEILILSVDPNQSPCYFRFEAPIPFDTALHVVQNNNNVHIWSIDYG